MSQYTPPPAPSFNPAQPGVAPHRGTLILVLGILGLVICFICGFVAWSMGGTDLRRMDAGTMDPSGRGITQAGKILGMVGGILGCIGMLAGLAWFIFAVFVIGAAAAAGSGGHP